MAEKSKLDAALDELLRQVDGRDCGTGRGAEAIHESAAGARDGSGTEQPSRIREA